MKISIVILFTLIEWSSRISVDSVCHVVLSHPLCLQRKSNSPSESSKGSSIEENHKIDELQNKEVINEIEAKNFKSTNGDAVTGLNDDKQQTNNSIQQQDEEKRSLLDELFMERTAIEERLKVEQNVLTKRELEENLNRVEEDLKEELTRIAREGTKRKQKTIPEKENKKQNESEEAESVEAESGNSAEPTPDNKQNQSAEAQTKLEESTPLENLYLRRTNIENKLKFERNTTVGQNLQEELHRVYQDITNELAGNEQQTKNNQEIEQTTKRTQNENEEDTKKRKSIKQPEQQKSKKPKNELQSTQLEKLYTERVEVEKKLKKEQNSAKKQILKQLLSEIVQNISNELKTISENKQKATTKTNKTQKKKDQIKMKESQLEKLNSEKALIKKQLKLEKNTGKKQLLKEKLNQIEQYESKEQEEHKNSRETTEALSEEEVDQEQDKKETLEDERNQVKKESKTLLEKLLQEKAAFESQLGVEANKAMRKILKENLKEIEQKIAKEQEKIQKEPENSEKAKALSKFIKNKESKNKPKKEHINFELTAGETKQAKEKPQDEVPSTLLEKLYAEQTIIKKRTKVEKNVVIRLILEKELNQLERQILREQEKTQKEQENMQNGKDAWNEKEIRDNKNEQQEEREELNAERNPVEEKSKTRLEELIKEKSIIEKQLGVEASESMEKILQEKLNEINLNIAKEEVKKVTQRGLEKAKELPIKDENEQNKNKEENLHREDLKGQMEQFEKKPTDGIQTTKLEKLFADRAQIETQLRVQPSTVVRQLLEEKLNEIDQDISKEQAIQSAKVALDKPLIETKPKELDARITQVKEKSRARLEKLKKKAFRENQNIAEEQEKTQEELENLQKEKTLSEVEKNENELRDGLVTQPEKKPTDAIQTPIMQKLYSKRPLIQKQLRVQKSDLDKQLLERKFNQIDQEISNEQTKAQKEQQNIQREVTTDQEHLTTTEEPDAKSKQIKDRPRTRLEELYKKKAFVEKQLGVGANDRVKEILQKTLKRIVLKIAKEQEKAQEEQENFQKEKENEQNENKEVELTQRNNQPPEGIQSALLEKLYSNRPLIQKQLRVEKSDFVKQLLEGKLNQIDQEISNEQTKAQKEQQNIQREVTIDQEHLTTTDEPDAKSKRIKESLRTRLEGLYKKKAFVEKQLGVVATDRVKANLEKTLKGIVLNIAQEQEKAQEEQENVQKEKENEQTKAQKEQKNIQREVTADQEHLTTTEEPDAKSAEIKYRSRTRLEELYKKKAFVEKQLGVEANDHVKTILEKTLKRIVLNIAQEQEKAQEEQENFQKEKENEQNENKDVELMQRNNRPPERIQSAILKKLYSNRALIQKQLRVEKSDLVKQLLEGKLNQIDQEISKEQKPKEQRNIQNATVIWNGKEELEYKRPTQEKSKERLKELFKEKAVLEKLLGAEVHPVRRDKLTTNLNETHQKIVEELKNMQQNGISGDVQKFKEKLKISQQEMLKKGRQTAQEIHVDLKNPINPAEDATTLRLKKLYIAKQVIKNRLKNEKNLEAKKTLEEKLNKIDGDITMELKNMPENDSQADVQKKIEEKKNENQAPLEMNGQLKSQVPPSKGKETDRLNRLFVEKQVIEDELEADENPDTKQLLQVSLNIIDQYIAEELKSNPQVEAQNSLGQSTIENKTLVGQKNSDDLKNSTETTEKRRLKKLYVERKIIGNILTRRIGVVVRRQLEQILKEIDEDISNELKAFHQKEELEKQKKEKSKSNSLWDLALKSSNRAKVAAKKELTLVRNTEPNLAPHGAREQEYHVKSLLAKKQADEAHQRTMMQLRNQLGTATERKQQAENENNQSKIKEKKTNIDFNLDTNILFG